MGPHVDTRQEAVHDGSQQVGVVRACDHDSHQVDAPFCNRWVADPLFFGNHLEVVAHVCSHLEAVLFCNLLESREVPAYSQLVDILLIRVGNLERVGEVRVCNHQKADSRQEDREVGVSNHQDHQDQYIHPYLFYQTAQAQIFHLAHA